MSLRFLRAAALRLPLAAFAARSAGAASLPLDTLRFTPAELREDFAIAPMKKFGRGILPDVAVRPTIGDLVAGRDPELAKALEIARSEATAAAR